MNTTSDQTLDNEASQHARKLLGFAAIMRMNFLESEFDTPSLATGGRAVVAGGWAVAMDDVSPPTLQFGRHGNCSPHARCVGCRQICSAEDPAVDLSVRSNSRSALWIEARNPATMPGHVMVRSLVPGRPGLSGVWIPSLCPITDELELIAIDSSRVARLQVDGHLRTSTVMPSRRARTIAATMFLRMWTSVSALQSIHGMASSGAAPMSVGAA